MIHPEWSSDLKSIFYLLSGHPVKHGISECPFPPICSILSLMGGVIWPMQGFFLSEVRWTFTTQRGGLCFDFVLSFFILVKNHMLLKKSGSSRIDTAIQLHWTPKKVIKLLGLWRCLFIQMIQIHFWWGFRSHLRLICQNKSFAAFSADIGAMDRDFGCLHWAKFRWQICSKIP